MGLLSFIFGKKKENKVEEPVRPFKAINDEIPAYMAEQEDQYGQTKSERQLERLRDKFEDYIDGCDETFTDKFSYTGRLNKINGYLERYRELEELAYKTYGRNDDTFKWELAEFHNGFKKKIDLNMNFNIEADDFNYEPVVSDACWYNVEFIIELKELYESKPNEVKELIKREQEAYERSGFETYADYLDELQFQKDLQRIKKDIKKYIADHDGVLQSELVSNYDVKFKNRIYDYIKELESKGSITKVKSGHSYSLHIKK